jgi:hypothetical protein
MMCCQPGRRPGCGIGPAAIGGLVYTVSPLAVFYGRLVPYQARTVEQPSA